jgi:hypothetical protein
MAYEVFVFDKIDKDGCPRDLTTLFAVPLGGTSGGELKWKCVGCEVDSIEDFDASGNPMPGRLEFNNFNLAIVEFQTECQRKDWLDSLVSSEASGIKVVKTQPS